MDILDLIFRVRTQELDQAEKKLDNVGKKAEDAERKAKGLGDALGGFSKLGGPIGQVADNISNVTDKADTALGSFGRVAGGVTLIATAAAATVAGLVSLSLKVADMADALNDMAKRTNISTERLSLMDAMAKMAGSSVEELVNSSERLGMKLAKQDEESGKAVTALKDLGISTKDTNGEMKSMIQLQEEIVLAVDKAAGSAKAEGAAVTLLGTDYYKLRTAIKETAEQKSEMYDYMQKVGSVVTTQLAHDSDSLNDSISKMDLAFKGMGNSIASITVPILNSVIDKLTSISTKAADIMRRWAGGSTAGELASDNVSRIQDQLAYKRNQLNGLAGRVPAGRDRIQGEIEFLEQELREAQLRQFRSTEFDFANKYDTLYGKASEGNRTSGVTKPSKATKQTDPSLTAEAIAKQQAEAADEWEKATAEAWKAWEKIQTDAYTATQKGSAELDKQAEAVRRLINPYREIEEELRQLTVLRDTGRLSDDDFAAAAQANADKMAEAQKRVSKSTKEMGDLQKFTLDTVGNLLTDLATGAEISGKAIARAFIKAAYDMLVIKPVLEQLKKLMESMNSGSGGGGIFGAILSGLGGLFGGGRASGGPVSSGRLYEVNERGTPELLNVGSRQYLMMGGQSGYVTPTGAAGGTGVSVGTVALTVNVQGTGDAKRDGEMAGNAAAVAFVQAIAQGEISRALRYGGQLNR